MSELADPVYLAEFCETMEHSMGISNFAGFSLAWLLVVSWFSYRAWRRGDGLMRVSLKVLISLVLAMGMVIAIKNKLGRISGDFTDDAPTVLFMVGLVVIGGVLLSILWTGEIAELVAAPLTNALDGGSECPKPKSATGKIASTTPVFATRETNPNRLAAVYVQRLEQCPHDAVVREKLAMLYARHFKRLDLATYEFEKLITARLHSRQQIVRWLKLLAKVKIELHASVTTVENTFDRVSKLYPHDLETKAARQRLAQARRMNESKI